MYSVVLPPLAVTVCIELNFNKQIFLLESLKCTTTAYEESEFQTYRQKDTHTNK